MVRSYRKLNAENGDLNKVQDNIEYALGPVLASAIIDGVQVNAIELTTTPLAVSHGLGRRPLGWIIVDQNADARVWSIARDKNVIILQASSPCTISVWAY